MSDIWIVVVSVAAFVLGVAAPFLFVLGLESRARGRREAAPSACYAPAEEPERPRAPLPPLAPESTRVAPVVDLAEHRNRRRPEGAAPAPAGALGRITKDASTDLRLRPAGDTFAAGMGAAAAHLSAAVAGAERGQWILARTDVALAALALVRVLGTMQTDDDRHTGH